MGQDKRTVCDVCRRPIRARRGRGRPRARHRRCAEIARLLSLIETEIERVRPFLPGDARNHLRRQFRYLANLLNAGDFVGEESLVQLDRE